MRPSASGCKLSVMTDDKLNISNDGTERQRLIARRWSAWLERAEIARKQGQEDVIRASLELASAYEQLSPPDYIESELLVKANLLRKQIESSEQHRTMSVEHGLGNEAIDVTLEIQELEKQLVALVLAGPQ
jgi:hypothetical protein